MMIEEYLKSRDNLKRVFLLIDYRHKPTEDDLLMFNFMKYYDLDVTSNEQSVFIRLQKEFEKRGFYLKVKQSDKAKNDKAIAETFKLGENDNIVLFSSISKKGREEILNIIDGSLGTK